MRALPTVLALTLVAGLAGAGWVLWHWTGPHGPARDLSVWPPPAAPVTAPPGRPLRLLVLGTSLSANRVWPEAVRAHLAACRGGDAELVLIAGPGENATWAVGQLDRVRAAGPVDLVVVEYAINDADITDGISRARARAAHGEILDTLAETSPEAVVTLAALSPAFGLRGVIRPGYDGYRALYAEIARARGVGFLDLDPTWRAALAAGDARALMPDGLHPTPAAVRQVAVPVLAERLGGLLAAPCPAPAADPPAG